MAYNPHNLSVLAYANGFTLWHYTSTDTAGEIDTSGYFNGAVELLRVGDMLMTNCDTDGTPVAGIMLVARSLGGVVDVCNLTQVGSTNTD